CLQDTQLLPTF
nr:immunoglobulin light chain junction region [Macaca mulatta]